MSIEPLKEGAVYKVEAGDDEYFLTLRRFSDSVYPGERIWIAVSEEEIPGFSQYSATQMYSRFGIEVPEIEGDGLYTLMGREDREVLMRIVMYKMEKVNRVKEAVWSKAINAELRKAYENKTRQSAVPGLGPANLIRSFAGLKVSKARGAHGGRSKVTRKIRRKVKKTRRKA